MKQLFPAVFESVWKRKETKIYLLFTLFPFIFLFASFLAGSNFMQIVTEEGYKISYLEFLDMMMNSASSIVLPTMAIYFLAISVFKREIDQHTLFLYRDLNRKSIFFAKYFSLLAVLAIFFGLFFVNTATVHYVRVVHLPFGTADVFPILEEIPRYLFKLFSYFLKDAFSLTIASVICLYLHTGASMVTGIIITISMMITETIGGPIAMVFPTGFNQLATSSLQGTLLATCCALGITLLYAIILSFIGAKKFGRLEF